MDPVDERKIFGRTIEECLFILAGLLVIFVSISAIGIISQLLGLEVANNPSPTIIEFSSAQGEYVPLYTLALLSAPFLIPAITMGLLLVAGLLLIFFPILYSAEKHPGKKASDRLLISSIAAVALLNLSVFVLLVSLLKRPFALTKLLDYVLAEWAQYLRYFLE